MMSFPMESGLMRRLPPLNALKAFEAAARSESFTRAAEELIVTPKRRPNLDAGRPVPVGRCRYFPQDFGKRSSGTIKQKLHLLFCKQRRRKHETHDNSISLCVRALQYVRACKNGSS